MGLVAALKRSVIAIIFFRDSIVNNYAVSTGVHFNAVDKVRAQKELSNIDGCKL